MGRGGNRAAGGERGVLCAAGPDTRPRVECGGDVKHQLPLSCGRKAGSGHIPQESLSWKELAEGGKSLPPEQFPLYLLDTAPPPRGTLLQS